MAIKLTSQQVADWSTKFQNLIDDEAGRNLFLQFLKTEFNEENLLFWLEVEHFRTLGNSDPAAFAAKAKSIYSGFIKSMVSKEINITAQARAKIEEELREDRVSENMFDSAQLEAFGIMHKHSYPRFLVSNVFLAVVESTKDK